MDELLKKIEEIRARAAEISKMDVIDDEARKELVSLRDERKDLEQKLEDEKLKAELLAEAPEVPAEEEAPAEETVEEVAAEPEVAEEVVEEEVTQEAIAAAVSESKPVDEPQAEAKEGLSIVAASTSFGLNVGSRMQFEDWQSVIRKAGQQGEGRHVVASIDRGRGADGVVSARNSAMQNSIIMSQSNKDGAVMPLTAAACYCGPFETKKDILSLGLDDRPVAGLFRSVPVNGPFKYVRDVNLADVAAGVTLWDCADQAAVDANTPSTWKPCVELDCLPDHQVDPYAIPACGIFSTFQQVSHPELVDDFITKLGIVYARRAEQALLDTLRADSTVLTYGLAGMGLLNELEGMLGHLAGFSGYVRRINWSDYALILPPGLMEALIADEHRRGFSRGANRTAIISQLRELGVGQVIEALDADTTAEADYLAAHGLYVAPGTTVAFNPCSAIGTWTINVVPVGAYTRGESQLVEAGFHRDADLIRQNKVQWFMEGHEFLEKMTPDVPSYTLEITGAGTGGTSALVTPEAC